MDANPTGNTVEAPAGVAEVSEDHVRVKCGRYRTVTEEDFVRIAEKGKYL